ncbi:MAG: zinc dependent phospholipase C family protein [Desulfonatronovibrionaceae bacterium]
MLYKTLLAVLGSIFFLCLDVKSALAWGPGVHLHTANYILSNLHLIAPAVAGIISAYPTSFKYGCLSADIYMGKGKKLHSRHCHNWGTGFGLLDSSRDPEIKAYAFGYLSHLAADTIAHNYFVPDTLRVFPGSGKMSHLYVEMQADRIIAGTSSQARDIMGKKNSQADRILRLALRKPKLRFALKKQLYRQGINFSRLHSWEISLRILDRALPWGESGYLRHMVGLSQSTVANFLQNPDHAACLDLDPMGFANLQVVKDMKRNPPCADRDPATPFYPDPRLKELSISTN